MTWFSPESNIVEIHKITVFMIWYSNAERMSSISKLHYVLLVCAFYIHDLTFPPGQTLWKYTRSVFSWPHIPMLKYPVPPASYTIFHSCLSWLDFPNGSNVIKVHRVCVFMNWYSTAERPCSFNKWHHVPISNSCLSHSWLHSAARSNTMKIQNVSVFMTQYSIPERPGSINKLHNVHIF